MFVKRLRLKQIFLYTYFDMFINHVCLTCSSIVVNIIECCVTVIHVRRLSNFNIRFNTNRITFCLNSKITFFSGRLMYLIFLCFHLIIWDLLFWIFIGDQYFCFDTCYKCVNIFKPCVWKWMFNLSIKRNSFAKPFNW